MPQLCEVNVERDTTNYYEAFGGQAFFSDLVSQFYAQVATNEILRPMYPESDMKGAAQRLQMFLEQYWGGPTKYQDEDTHDFACAMLVFISTLRQKMPGLNVCVKLLMELK
jgi:truncated hemoglobin YjbI